MTLMCKYIYIYIWLKTKHHQTQIQIMNDGEVNKQQTNKQEKYINVKSLNAHLNVYQRQWYKNITLKSTPEYTL